LHEFIGPGRQEAARRRRRGRGRIGQAPLFSTDQGSGPKFGPKLLETERHRTTRPVSAGAQKRPQLLTKSNELISDPIMACDFQDRCLKPLGHPSGVVRSSAYTYSAREPSGNILLRGPNLHPTPLSGLFRTAIETLRRCFPARFPALGRCRPVEQEPRPGESNHSHRAME
jgi:hypothetical protein